MLSFLKSIIAPPPGPKGVFRGAQLTPRPPLTDLEALAASGCNLVRYQYRTDFDTDPSHLLATLDKARQCGIRVAIALMVMPADPVATWERIAGAVVAYGLRDAVYGYDLLNEPPMADDQWDTLAQSLRRAVRLHDRRTAIILSGTYGDPNAMRRVASLGDRNVIHTFHHYHPFAYTHQGVYPQYLMPRARPEKARLEEHLARVKQWQDKTGARVYVGEFSTARWAPEGARYLRDCMSIFEQYGWDWTYHAWREWHGWSLEHNEDINHVESVGNSARKRIVFRYLSRSRSK